MQCPTCAYAAQCIKAFGIAGFAGVEVDGATALGKALPSLQSDIEIDETIVAHVKISNKLVQSQAIAQAIVAFEVFSLELRDLIFLMLNADFVLHKTNASKGQDAAVFVGPDDIKKPSSVQGDHVTALLDGNFGQLSLDVHDVPAFDGEVRHQTWFNHSIAKLIRGLNAVIPICFAFDVKSNADIAAVAKSIDHFSSRQVKGVADGNVWIEQ